MFTSPHELVLAVEVGSLRPLTFDLTRRNGLQGTSRPIRHGMLVGEIGLGMRGKELVVWLRDISQMPPRETEKALDFPATTIVAGTLSATILIVFCQWHPSSGIVQELETELMVIRRPAGQVFMTGLPASRILMKGE